MLIDAITRANIADGGNLPGSLPDAMPSPAHPGEPKRSGPDSLGIVGRAVGGSLPLAA